jgi:DNA repair protein SbcC/Rad50
MDIKLKELQLRNFKGIKELTILFDEKQTDIYGANASGKTTVFDGFCYLLFGKDSLDRANFDIKTLDAFNNPINRLEHSVVGILSVDGMDKRLQKIYKEKWVKKSGKPEPEFSGHETDHFIDLVPVSKKDYETVIATLINESVFKMITNPFAFANLKWQDKREIVVKIAGEISPAVVAESDVKFKELLEKMEGRKIEDHLKVVAAKKRELKEFLSHVPARINELNSSIFNLDKAVIDAKMSEIEQKIAKIKAEIDQKNGSGSEKLAKKKALEVELTNLSSQKQAKKVELMANFVGKKERELALLVDQHSRLIEESRKIETIENGIESLLYTKTELLKRRNDLLGEYNGWNATEFTANENDRLCKACGQELPNAEGILDVMRDKFLKNKSQCIEEIKIKGGKIKENILELDKSINEGEYFLKTVDKAELNQKIIAASVAISEMKKTIALASHENFPYTENDARIAAVEQSLSEFGKEDTTELNNSLSGLQIERDEVVKQLKQIETNSETLTRIEQIKKEEKTISNELAKLEKEEYLALQFNKTKMQMMEEHIRAKFGNVVFKMYSSLINGGEEPTCQILIDGVPFDNTNRAAQINTGIKIINTLSEHYDVKAPIFVDNAEAVNTLTETESQLIRLVVVEPGFKKEGAIILETIK